MKAYLKYWFITFVCLGILFGGVALVAAIYHWIANQNVVVQFIFGGFFAVSAIAGIIYVCMETGFLDTHVDESEYDYEEEDNSEEGRDHNITYYEEKLSLPLSESSTTGID